MRAILFTLNKLSRAAMLLCAMSLAIFSGAQLWAADMADTAELPGGVKLVLNGVGIARELSGELYIGGLYVDQRTNNPGYMTRTDVPKRMSIRIVPDRMFGRRFGQLWREQILINNDRKTVQDMAEDVLNFIDLFSNNLTTGDQVNFDFQPGKGTRVTVNGTEIAVIKKPELISLLVNCWIGERPPNVQFKQGVMGDLDKATAVGLIERYATLKPSAARIAESKNYMKKEDAAAAAEAAKAAAKAEAKKEEPKKEEVKPVKPVETKPVETKPVVQAPAPVVVAPAPVPVQAAPAPVEKEPVQVVETPAPAVEKVVTTAPAQSAADRLNEYQTRRTYERKLLAYIGKFQEYPWDKLRRKYGNDLLYNPKQGKAMIRVTIARDGTVKSSNLDQSTGDRILDEAALSMVEKANPLPPMPDKLNDTEFEFMIEVVLAPGKQE